MLEKFKENKWSVLAAGGLLLAVLSSKGGAAALIPFVRILLPFILLYMIYRVIKRKFLDSAVGALKKQMEAQMQAQQQKQGDTIDLCPKCGVYLKPGHRCG